MDYIFVVRLLIYILFVIFLLSQIILLVKNLKRKKIFDSSISFCIMIFISYILYKYAGELNLIF